MAWYPNDFRNKKKAKVLNDDAPETIIEVKSRAISEKDIKDFAKYEPMFSPKPDNQQQKD